MCSHFSIVLVFSLISLCLAQQRCGRYTDSKGRIYDLTPLNGSLFVAKNIYDPITKGTYDYEFVACGPYPKLCNSPMNYRPSGVCQVMEMCVFFLKMLLGVGSW